MRTSLALALTACVLAHPALAEDAAPAPEKSFWERDTMLGDPGGLRSKLIDHGITLSLSETSEGFANVGGGIRRSTVYEGLTQVSLKLDSSKLGLWEGGTFYASALQIHGRGPSRYLVGNLQTVSGIESVQSTKLYDLYVEQTLFGGKVSVRAGQFGADEEFIASSYGLGFVNSSFGFPILPASDLPNGGPAYPLAALGARVKYAATDAITVLGAVFNGNPMGPSSTLQNNSGTDFRTTDGVFAIAELQYALNQGEKDTGLPGTYKIGAWYQSQTVIAPPNGRGTQSFNGNYSFYAVADQLVWRQGEKSADSADPGKQRGIGVFARVMGAPGNRNLIDFAASAGVVWHGPFDARTDDQIAVGVNYAHVGSSARAFDQFIGTFSRGYPIRSSETTFELNYLAQLTGWLQVQPSIQYVVRPGANVLNPNQPNQTIKNATILGLRGIVTF